MRRYKGKAKQLSYPLFVLLTVFTTVFIFSYISSRWHSILIYLVKKFSINRLISVVRRIPQFLSKNLRTIHRNAENFVKNRKLLTPSLENVRSMKNCNCYSNEALKKKIGEVLDSKDLVDEIFLRFAEQNKWKSFVELKELKFGGDYVISDIFDGNESNGSSSLHFYIELPKFICTLSVGDAEITTKNVILELHAYVVDEYKISLLSTKVLCEFTSPQISQENLNWLHGCILGSMMDFFNTEIVCVNTIEFLLLLLVLWRRCPDKIVDILRMKKISAQEINYKIDMIDGYFQYSSKYFEKLNPNEKQVRNYFQQSDVITNFSADIMEVVRENVDEQTTKLSGNIHPLGLKIGRISFLRLLNDIGAKIKRSMVYVYPSIHFEKIRTGFRSSIGKNIHFNFMFGIEEIIFRDINVDLFHLDDIRFELDIKTNFQVNNDTLKVKFYPKIKKVSFNLKNKNIEKEENRTWIKVALLKLITDTINKMVDMSFECPCVWGKGEFMESIFNKELHIYHFFLARRNYEDLTNIELRYGDKIFGFDSLDDLKNTDFL